MLAFSGYLLCRRLDSQRYKEIGIETTRFSSYFRLLCIRLSVTIRRLLCSFHASHFSNSFNGVFWVVFSLVFFSSSFSSIVVLYIIINLILEVVHMLCFIT